MSEWSIRAPAAEDMPVLADIWHDGWHEAHAMHVPAGLVAVRTREDFRRRLAKMLERTRVIGLIGEPLGLCAIREDELMHLFVASAARGAGHAIALLRDGEARLRSNGVRTAWLSCTIGNRRAARFYEREGWVRSGEIEYMAETPSGALPLTEWKYEKNLVLDSGQSCL